MKYLKLVLFCLINLIICFYPSSKNDFFIQIVYFIVLTISTYFILFKSRRISLNTVFYLFIYLFFGVAPIIQYKEMVFFFKTKSPLVTEDFLLGGYLSLFILIIYSVSYFVLYKKVSIKFRINQKLNTINYNRFYFVLFILVIAIIVINYGNIEGLFLRYKYNRSFGVLRSSLDASISIVPLLMLIYFKAGGSLKVKQELLLLLVIVLLNFPFAISRFELGLVYFTLAIVYFKFIRDYFVECFIFGIIIIFPLFNAFRYKGIKFLNNSNPYGQFLELDFDSFQNTLGVIKQGLITNGEQLMASLLFFIPRSSWSDKPNSSANLLCESLGFDGYCNVAISYFGEGYVNFGYVGILFFIILLALYNLVIDKCYYENKFYEYKYIYVLFVFHEFYLLRGSLTAAVIKFSMIILAIMLTQLCNKVIFGTEKVKFKERS